MAKTKPETGETPSEPHTLSRREFALGPIAVLGAHSLLRADTLPPLSPEAAAWKLEMTDTVRRQLELRHITEGDLRRVLAHAESTGGKLCSPEGARFLSKLRMEDTYFYVEYSPIDSGFRVDAAYAHRLLLEGDPR